MKSTQRTQALAAGISLIIMALLAAFAYGYVLSGIEVQDDPAATFKQLVTRASIFKAGLGGWVLIFLTDLIVTISLYLFFSETRKRLSLFTAAARLAYTAILGIALIKLFSILPLLNEQGINAALAGQQVLVLLESFDTTWSMGLIIFGVHLLGLGNLSKLSPQIPSLFAYLLLLAGLGYIGIPILENSTGMDEEVVSVIEKVLMAPMAAGEILLALWLIIRGGRGKSYL
jgi:hypothetical protein